MAIKVIAQLREVKIGKKGGCYPLRYLRRCDQGSLGCCWRSDPHLGYRRSLHPPARSWHHALRRAFEGGGEAGGREGKPDQRAPHHLHPERGCEGRAEEHLDSDHLSR